MLELKEQKLYKKRRIWEVKYFLTHYKTVLLFKPNFGTLCIYSWIRTLPASYPQTLIMTTRHKFCTYFGFPVALLIYKLANANNTLAFGRQPGRLCSGTASDVAEKYASRHRMRIVLHIRAQVRSVKVIFRLGSFEEADQKMTPGQMDAIHRNKLSNDLKRCEKRVVRGFLYYCEIWKQIKLSKC